MTSPADPAFLADPAPLNIGAMRSRADELLTHVDQTLQVAHAEIGQRALDAAWATAQALHSAEAKLSRVIDTLRARAKATWDATELAVETAINAKLGSAMSFARQAGLDLTGLIEEIQGRPAPPATWGDLPDAPPVVRLQRATDPPVLRGDGVQLPGIAGEKGWFPAPLVKPAGADQVVSGDGDGIATIADQLTASAPIAGATATGSAAMPSGPTSATATAPLAATTATTSVPPISYPAVYSCTTGQPSFDFVFSWGGSPGWTYSTSGELLQQPLPMGWILVAKTPHIPGSVFNPLTTTIFGSIPDNAVCAGTTPPPVPPPPPPTPPPVPPPPPPPPPPPTPCPPPPPCPPIPDITDCNRPPFPGEPIDPFDGLPMYCTRPPQPGGGAPNPFSVPMFTDPAACAAAASLNFSNLPQLLSQLFGAYSWNPLAQPFITPQWIIDIAKILPSPLAQVLAIWLQPLDIGWNAVMGSVQGQPNCDPATVTPVAILSGLFGLISKYIGPAGRKPGYRLDRWYDYLCPDMIPSQGEVDSLYTRQYIGKDLWECWTRANNNQPETRHGIIAAMEKKPGVQEIIKLMHRGHYSAQTADAKMRFEGVQNAADRAAFKELATFVPGSGDLIRFMVKDVFDPNVVTAWGLDDDFATKFQGDAVTIADANGIDAATLKLFWRSHWRLPTNSEAFHMYHRCRPGRVPANLVFDKTMLRDMLQINDIAPKFVDRLVEIARPVIRIIDARKIFFYGIWQFSDVENFYLDRGYSQADATAEATVWEIEQKQWVRRRPWWSKWVDGYYTDAEADNAAILDGMKVIVSNKYGVEIREERDRITREICTDAIHKRFLIADVNAAAAVPLLTNIGHNLDFAIVLVQRWQCELGSRGKVIGASELCQWAEWGLISQADYKLRLIALGYTANDASRVAAICGIRIKAHQAAAKKGGRPVPPGPLAVAQAVAGVERNGSSRLGATVAARTAKDEEMDERDTIKLFQVAAKLSMCCEVDESEAIDLIKTMVNQIIADHGYSRRGAIDILNIAITQAKSRKDPDPTAYLNAFIGALPPPDEPDLLHGPDQV